MFYLNRETELGTELLSKMINHFHTTVQPKLNKYKEYYDGQQAILQKRYEDSTKPCNKTVINYAKNIVDSYCGYLATPGYISYSSKEDIEDVMEVLKYNDYQAEDADFLLDALIYGVACELMYVDNEGKTRFRLINPSTCFGVCDDTLSGDLMYFVRMYKANNWTDDDIYKVDVYTDYNVKHYTMAGMGGELTFIDEEFHFFNQCPANIFALPDEKSIFDCIISLQDDANELLSGEIDDYAAFVDAFLTFTGGDMTEEDVANLEKGKQKRTLLLPEGVSAGWLTKNSTDTQVENILNRVHESIYRVAACPDFSSESFVGGVSSGIAIQYRLTGMETRAGKIEAEMKKALQRRVELIAGIASLKLGDAVFRDIQIEFSRNIPEDKISAINSVITLKGSGLVSDETLLTQLDFISDPAAELEAVKKQKEENASLYGFGAFGSIAATDEEDEEVDE